MTISNERLRQIANGDGATIPEWHGIATELLAARERIDEMGGAAILDKNALGFARDLRDAAIARAEKAEAERDAVTRHRDDLLTYHKRDVDLMIAAGAIDPSRGMMTMGDAIPKLAQERDAARAEVERLRAELAARDFNPILDGLCRRAGTPEGLLPPLIGWINDARAYRDRTEAALMKLNRRAGNSREAGCVDFAFASLEDLDELGLARDAKGADRG